MNNFTIAFFLFDFVKQKLDSVEIKSPTLARWLCRIIPNSCPFEREIRFFNHIILTIPPLCKLNPFYEQLVTLRFKSLIYLSEQ